MGMEMLSMYISSYLSAHTILKFKFKVKIGEINLRVELLFINIFCVFLGTNQRDEVQQTGHFTSVNQFHF